jgi:hypothetical protein
VPTKTLPRSFITRIAWSALAAFVATSSLLLSPVGAQGIGISPVEIQMKDALRGGTFVNSITVTNSLSTDAQFDIRVSNGDFAPWVTFSRFDDATRTPTSNFTVKAGDRVMIVVTAAVPATAGNGTYSGQIEIAQTATPTDVKAGGSAVGIGGLVNMSIAVGGVERREAVLSDVYVEGAEVGLDQRFNAKIKNTGNVTVKGQLDVKITRGTTTVAELTSAGGLFPALPSQDGLVYVDWKTADQQAGNYKAEFKVTDVAATPPKLIGTQTVDFRLDPRGTITRAGALNELKLLNTPEPNGVAQVGAVFFNSGKIDTKVVFEGELYRNGKLVRPVTGLERVAKQGALVTVQTNIELGESGEYMVKGKINFEGNETETKELTFKVGTQSGGSSKVPLIAAGGGIVLLLLIIAAMMSRRRRRDRAAEAERQASRRRRMYAEAR